MTERRRVYNGEANALKVSLGCRHSLAACEQQESGIQSNLVNVRHASCRRCIVGLGFPDGRLPRIAIFVGNTKQFNLSPRLMAGMVGFASAEALP